MGNKHIRKTKGMYCSFSSSHSKLLSPSSTLPYSAEFNFHSIPEEIELPSSDRDSLNPAI